MAVSFTNYLDAREQLDRASMNGAVWERFLEVLSGELSGPVLDVGCGTGAMFRYICNALPMLAGTLVGAELSGECVRAAQASAEQLQQPAGPGRAPPAARSIRFRRADFLNGELRDLARVGVVTAKSFCDMVPLPQLLNELDVLLRPGGWFYAPINYNGKTTFAPEALDPGFERALLRTYDRSMDERTRAGEPVGGSESGVRLIGALRSHGYETVYTGPSDWCVSPTESGYAGAEELATRAMLETIHGEGRKHPDLRAEPLDRWFASRLSQLERGELSMVIHQLDVLARKPGSAEA